MPSIAWRRSSPMSNTDFAPGDRFDYRLDGTVVRGKVLGYDAYNDLASSSWYRVQFDGKDTMDVILGCHMIRLGELDRIIESM